MFCIVILHQAYELSQSFFFFKCSFDLKIAIEKVNIYFVIFII